MTVYDTYGDVLVDICASYPVDTSGLVTRTDGSLTSWYIPESRQPILQIDVTGPRTFQILTWFFDDAYETCEVNNITETLKGPSTP